MSTTWLLTCESRSDSGSNTYDPGQVQYGSPPGFVPVRPCCTVPTEGNIIIQWLWLLFSTTGFSINVMKIFDFFNIVLWINNFPMEFPERQLMIIYSVDYFVAYSINCLVYLMSSCWKRLFTSSQSPRQHLQIPFFVWTVQNQRIFYLQWHEIESADQTTLAIFSW